MTERTSFLVLAAAFVLPVVLAIILAFWRNRDFERDYEQAKREAEERAIFLTLADRD